MYEKTLTSALEEASKNNIEEWIHFFLTTGYNKNPAFSEGLKQEQRIFYGPVKVQLSQFERVCGPEDNMLYLVNKEYFNHKVNTMMNNIKDGWDMPPLIIEVNKDGFFLNDGNHRFEALSRLGITEYHVIFWCSQKDSIDINTFEHQNKQ